MYTLRIKHLEISTLLGVYDWEQQQKRTVVFNIEMLVAPGNAALSDDIADAADYAVIESRIVKYVEETSHKLLERLVSEVAELILLLDPRIQRVTVEADKPGALAHSRSVSLSCTRIRP